MTSVRDLPSVDQVVTKLADLSVPRSMLVRQVRAAVEQCREALLAGRELASDSVEEMVCKRIRQLRQRSLRPVINATGVILHTNLGRAPLASFQPIPRYSNLEYDLETGKRGKRDAHTAKLLHALLQRTSIVVNNNAAAVFLVLNELAAGYEVVVSRGELIEIGDGFRIPDIMSRSGAILREVGTTNRTRVEDYAEAINDRTRLVLRVHRSNFRVTGFTSSPELRELAQLGRERGIPVYEDLGSGCLVDLQTKGIREPLVSDSFDAGVNVLSFSCDKLLGGPQSGIIAGDPELVRRIRRNPMYRTFRVDKLVIESLEQTLRHLLFEHWDAIPTLQMICPHPEQLKQRAERVAAALPGARVREHASPIGGGSTPDQMLPTWVVELNLPNAAILESSLRSGPIPVIARIEHNLVLLDMRTVADEETQDLIRAVKACV
ncbi:MAG: L-seryl-tRNA(Sec) selenium transferase [Acidobacteriaceae bacterium]|nr:L-seryl-tRNA(Sec) selenium transferase [Acidobacteriaceae bacterium]